MPKVDAVKECFPGPRVRRAREARGWSTYDLERESKVDASVISRIEGRTSFGRPETLLALSRALGLGFAGLFADAPAASSAIPLDGEVSADGSLRSMTASAGQTPALGSGELPASTLIPVAEPVPGGFAVRLGLESPVRVGVDPSQEHELRPGDVLLFRRLERGELPPVGALVYATRTNDDGDEVAAELRLYFEARGKGRVAAIIGDDEGRLDQGWSVEAVVVEQRRRFR